VLRPSAGRPAEVGEHGGESPDGIPLVVEGEAPDPMHLRELLGEVGGGSARGDHLDLVLLHPLPHNDPPAGGGPPPPPDDAVEDPHRAAQPYHQPHKHVEPCSPTVPPGRPAHHRRTPPG